MSEWINNVTRRKEILKNVLRQLHEGKSVEDVKSEFGELAREADSNEIAEIEQMLIDEGLPVEEVQNLCDVHVAVFREGLEQQKTPETIPGHPVFTFRSENQLLARVLNGLHDALEALNDGQAAPTLEQVRERLATLAEFNRHYLRKENLLFPYLEHYGFTGPSKVMWGVHDQIRATLRELRNSLPNANAAHGPDLETFRQRAGELEIAMREMIYKEEKILFPAALSHLSEAEWAAIRAQEAELGYFLLSPSQEWRPSAAPAAAATDPAAQPAAPSGELALDTGLLTLEQINLMLTHLPVDVTFVDEHDTVRYFTQSAARIFERQPAIIGRKVQNCHPPQSVDRVQRILDDFRAGKRSSAEFWIQMAGKFVHIRYFALRDAAGVYRGTIEVTQDIAPLRALQGERRLLDQ